MKILITGGTGFIGRHVIAKARGNGHDIRVLTRQPLVDFTGEKDWENNVEFVQQDLSHPVELSRALEGIDAVIHCAAAMSGDHNTQNSQTVLGTQNLLGAMTKAGVKHIVGISTLAIYDFQKIPSGSALDENSPLVECFDGAAPYIEMKRRQEDTIRDHGTSHNWDWTILRPGIVYGKTRTWSYHLGSQLGRRQWVAYAGSSPLPLSYVENCADAIVSALESKAATGATVNIVDDDLPTRQRYLEILATKTNPRPRIMTLPWTWLRRLSDIADWTNRKVLGGRVGLPGLLQPASLHARCKPLQYSNARAKKILRWQPEYDLEMAVERIFSDSPSNQ